MYIFHIPSWVPSEEEPFNGNFITRHIEAISSYIPCITLQLFKSRDCREKLINREKENNINRERLNWLIHLGPYRYYPKMADLSQRATGDCRHYQGIRATGIDSLACRISLWFNCF